jgi:6-phosphogluconolactonase
VAYAVTVKTQPRVLSQICTVTNDSGTIVASPVDNVLVSCVTPPPRFAYVTNSGSNNVSAYTVNATTGTLTPVAGSPFATGSTPYSVAVDPTGKFVYVPSSSGTVWAYALTAATGALTSVTGSPFATGTAPFSVAVDPSGKFAYVANLGSNNVSAYTIDTNTGALTQITGSPFTAGSNPTSVVITR